MSKEIQKINERFNDRKDCLFRYNSLSRCCHCTIKDRILHPTDDNRHCDFYNKKDLIPHDCPLKDKDIMVGLLINES